MNLKTLVWILGFLVILAASSLSHAAPKAVGGYLDLSGWDFDQGGVVQLDGEWDFYWNQLIDPGELAKGDAPRPTGTIQVPGTWNDQVARDGIFRGHGFATYRLRIQHNTDKSLAISLRFASTAYTMWVNGEMVASNGVVGQNVVESEPQYLPVVVPIPARSEPIDLVIHVANFRHRAGGLVNSIALGPLDEILRVDTMRVVGNVFLVSALFVLGIYHLMIHYWFGRGKSFLYFGLFSLVIVIRALVMGDHVLGRLIGGMPWELEVRIEYTMGYLAVAAGTMLIRSLYPEEMSMRFARPIVAYGLIGAAVSMFVPAVYMSMFMPFMMATVVVFIVYYGYVLVLALLRKRDGARLYLVAASILLLSVLHDLYSFHRAILGINLIPMGMLIVSLIQALIIARRVGYMYQHEVALAEENKALYHQVSKQMEDVKRSRKLFAQAEDRLRRHVAETLHGRVQTRLVLNWHHLGEALNTFSTQPEKAQELVRSVREDLADLREHEIRQVSHLLHPGVIRAGLRAAVDSLVRRFDGSAAITVEMDPQIEVLDDPLENQIPEEIRLVAYRVLEESLGNVAAHADADRVEIALFFEDPGYLQIVVRDDGRGFDTSKQDESGGLGLHGMKARVQTVGGTLKIDSRMGEGTTIEARLPIGAVFDADDPSIRDAATGLFSKSYGADALRQQMGLARRIKLPLAVMHIELKLGGDIHQRTKWEDMTVVRGVAEVLLRVLRAADIAYRYDENQIVLILPNTSRKDGYRVAERLAMELTSIESSQLFHISVGIAVFPDDGTTEEALVVAACQSYHKKDYTLGGSSIGA